MSHAEQLAFLALGANANPEILDGARVIEVGSYDVNGSVRAIFSRARKYVGVDLVSGPGVDLVQFGHEVDHPDGAYDIAVSGECFEHDPHWQQTFANMVRLTRPGGLVMVTCASRGRVEHGTRRSGAHLSPGTQSAGIDYYRNVHREEVQDLPLHEWFESYGLWYLASSFDLYFMGIRTGGVGGRLPTPAQVDRLAALTSWPLRIMRFPLRVALRVLGDNDRYQSLAVPYWRRATAAGDSVVHVLGKLRVRRL